MAETGDWETNKPADFYMTVRGQTLIQLNDATELEGDANKSPERG